jgi:hypothetical protein
MTVDRHELSMQRTNRPAMTDYIDAGLRQLASRLRSAAVVLCAFACTAALAAPKAPTAPAQRTFASAEAAVNALVEAVKKGDRAALVAVLGKEAEGSLSSGDKVADRITAERFIARFETKHAIVADGDSRATLTIDTDDFPFAFPLVKTPAGWRFDAKAGNAELLARRVGENELAVMNVLLAIVDAQREYASLDRGGNRAPEYAAKFASTPGKKDGLYWPTAAGEPPSPLGTLVAHAAGQGYKRAGGPQPYHGYYFLLLKGNGANARGGAYDYTVKGRTIGGFGVVAYPAKYANSGVMTFIVNHDGVVYQKDLGPDSANIARGITRFDPGPGWKAESVQ